MEDQDLVELGLKKIEVTRLRRLQMPQAVGSLARGLGVKTAGRFLDQHNAIHSLAQCRMKQRGSACSQPSRHQRTDTRPMVMG